MIWQRKIIPISVFHKGLASRRNEAGDTKSPPVIPFAPAICNGDWTFCSEL